MEAWSSGRPAAFDELVPLVYRELRTLAARQMRRERPDHTLETTGLVHEAFLKLVQQNGLGWSDRSHFFAFAATVMRRVLIDHARRRAADKRGGGTVKVSLDGVALAVRPTVDVIDLESCLERLEELDPRLVRIVELRYFAGCTVQETAEVLGVSPSTIKREWRMARAWLRQELGQGS